MRKFTKQVTISLAALGILWAGSVSFAAKDVKINEENFPNKQFYEWVSKNADKNSDGSLTQKEIEAVIKMDLSNKKINTLQGIEYFDKLEELDCSDNSLESLDVSKNKALTSLDCSGNSLSDIDVSGSDQLTVLDCENNGLKKLELKNNMALTELNCDENRLTKLDVSKNTKLKVLKCSDNNLLGLNLAQHKNLKELESDNNQLAYINLADVKLEDISSLKKQSVSSMAYYEDGKWRLDMTSLVEEENADRVKVMEGGTYNEKDGIVICDSDAEQIVYEYAMKKDSDEKADKMQVSVVLTKKEKASVRYETYVQKTGWTDAVSDGLISGTTGKKHSIQGIKISLDSESTKGGIQYRVYMQDKGWLDWTKDGKLAGIEKGDRRAEAVEIKLTGDVAEDYDVYYRTHVEDVGWLDWVKDGETAGSKGLSLRAEAIQIRLVKKGDRAPGRGEKGFIVEKDLNVSDIQYSVFAKDTKWQKAQRNGAVAGNTETDTCLEAIKVKVPNSLLTRSVKYRTHVKNVGWLDWSADGSLSGSVKQGLPIEAVQMTLVKELTKKYDIYYCAFVKGFGWQDWVKDGETAGTTGQKKGIKAIEVQLVEKGKAAPKKKA